jgi:serine/threonine protein kinase HipA of HipAB toxin-antitoxin module
MKVVDTVITLCKDNGWDAPQISVNYADGTEDYSQITWVDGNPNNITVDQIKAKQAELQAEYDSKQYSRDRQSEYPPATDYLDGVVKGDQGQIDKYIADCLAVKDKYPK